MKQSPQREVLEKLLRSDKIVLGGFMGTDNRDVYEIIDSDRQAIELAGHNCKAIADKMKQITEQAKPGIGNPVKISENLTATVDDWRGKVTCPWPHPGTFPKRITTLKRTDTGKQIQWTDLNIHMITEHCFFEGKGSRFRIEPKQIIEMLF